MANPHITFQNSMNKTLNNYKKNIFSQYGEDGILEEILKRLVIKNGTCIEFGAWDGVLLSNTANLWKNGWKGILIEQDDSKFERLTRVTDGYNCINIKKFVKPTGLNSIENIIKDKGIDFNEIKLLSIDIDGNEYHIIKNLSKLRPSILIAEYNPTIPKDMELISKEDAFFGSSARSIVEISQSKGYKLVAITETNCIFVDNKFSDNFSDLDTSFDSLFNNSNLTYLITGYNGNYAFSKYPSYGMTLSLNPENIEKGKLYFMNHSELKSRWNYIKDWIKTIGKKIIGTHRISRIKEWKGYIIWKIKGSPIPAHGIYKWKILNNVSKKFGIKTFIETGTAGGGTVRKMQKYFDKLYTIELDPTLYHQGKATSTNSSKITFLEGDSGQIIKDILSKLNTPAVFWLDAHYSGTGTAKADLETPIIEEIKNIFNHPIKKHVIVIDDMREFNGTHDYPTFEFLTSFIKENAPEYTWHKDNDILIISPNMD